ncbi:MAG: hypothetical protein Q8M02_02090 [Candidatus Didemnitutus sp.]|nr:hypothetical protein [Candidatus Didemnitutus sp.]
MDISLKADLDRLRTLAFRRYRCSGPVLRSYHKLRHSIDAHEHANLIWALYHWLLVPLSLWPVDIAGVATHVLDRTKKGKKLDADLVLLLETLGVAPVREACDVMGGYEHEVAKGNYDGLVKCHQKFAECEKLLSRSAEFRAAWRKIRKQFNVAKFRLKRGVIRRQMSQERNFRDGLNFNWQSKDARFRQLFDVLCFRWNLYGVQNNQPLLMKITVNPTPHGTMIFIPRYWSLDLSRDLNGKEIGRLHHAHGAIRQGPKMSPSRMERRDEAIKALKAWKEAGRQGLRGDGRFECVLQALGRPPESDFSAVKRLLREARSLS